MIDDLITIQENVMDTSPKVVVQSNGYLPSDEKVHIVTGFAETQHADDIAPSISVIGDKSRHKGHGVDFNFNSKTRGHLVSQSTCFAFIGPDKPVALSNVHEFLEIAHIVNETGTSNYKQARIPVKSGLNIEAC